MSQGRTSALILDLAPAAVGVLLACQRAPTRPAGLTRRARIVLLRHQGLSISAISRLVGISRRHVYVWLGRYQQEGFAGLANRGRKHDHGPKKG